MGAQLETRLLKQMCDGFLAHELEPTLRSEAAPVSEARPGEPQVIVTHMLEKLRDDPTDVLLLVYASWCPHSQAMLPIYERLARRFEGARQVLTIGKIDVDKNDVPKWLEVTAVPSLTLMGQGRKSIKFSGSRTEEDMVRFLLDSARHSKEILRFDAKANTVKSELKNAAESRG
eukprot:c6281_g1_i1.p1 GENE.c6281_g1_i1~~c6281_g1_i1.p1  ORF type:complete len:174 (+),score=28.06 c6281_g1_i1:1-522(+)